MLEKRPFCGEELDALPRRLRELENKVAELEGAEVALSDNEARYGETIYIASSERSIFHRPRCRWASYIEHSPNCLYFDSHEEAVEAGYKPCKTCRA